MNTILERAAADALAAAAKKPVTYAVLGDLVAALGEATREQIALASAALQSRIETLERRIAELEGAQ